MADLSKVKISGTTYDIKDATGRTLITAAEGKIAAEETRAKGVESGLDTRVSNLEARGRYLSTWDASSGLPGDYPEIPEGAASPYTYTYKAGDYYIINNVPATGTKYMPDGASITATKEGDVWTWSVGKKAYEGTSTLVVGGQFIYSKSSWTYVATAKDVAWGNITGTLADQTDLKTALDAKLDHKSGKSGTAGDLAYKDSASASYTPAGSIAALDVTPAGSVALNDLTQTSTAASLTKGDFTPAGSVAGTVTATGTVTLNAFTQTATDITSTGKFTPAGTVAAVEGGNFAAVKTATFAETTDGATGSVQIAGTVSKPAITVNDDTTDTFVKSLKPGDVDAAGMDSTKFSGGSFTGATPASYTQGTDTFTQGTQAALTTSNISYVESGITAAMDTTDTEMLVITSVTAKSAKAVDTFTANTLPTFTQGDDTFTANEVGTFTPAAVSAGFVTSQKLPVVDGTAAAVTAVTAELASAPAFTGKSYIVNTTTDTALKTVAFTGTEGNLSVAGQYDKATANGATFAGNATGDAITATFTGTKAENVLVTGVNYDKATANGATFTGTEKSVTPEFTGTAATITVS